MAFPERLLTDGEKIVREFRPHWRLLVIPVLWVVAAIVAMVLVYQLIPPKNGTADLITSLVLGVALIPLAVAPVVQWWFTGYILTNERLITRRGVLARSGVEIPLENINNVIFSQNVLERVLRSGDLLVESAGESGQSRFSDIPQPEEFQALLYRTREERTRRIAQEEGAIIADATSQHSDATSRLERLAKLHREGAITDAEFEVKKKALLDEI